MPYIVKYSLQRIGLLILTTFIILSLTFFLVKMLPDAVVSGNEAAQYAFWRDQANLGYVFEKSYTIQGYGEAVLTYQDPDGIMHIFYREPIIRQYGAWLKGIFTSWNWGTSSAIQPGSGAMDIIWTRLGPTVIINIFAMLISVPLGFVFGIIAALNKNKWPDHLISTLVMVMISVPSFVTISVLMLLLSYNTSWLPSHWPSSGGAGAYAAAMVIPVLSLVFGTVAGFTRYTRAELTEVISSDFLLLARTKGLTRTQCIVRHALRNSMVPIVPMIIGEFVGILSGSMILEQLYSIPGIGGLFVNAITYKDWNVLLVDMAVYTMIGLLANLLVDLSYGIIDPRIRMGAKAA